MGDVHACADELATLLDLVEPTTTVFVGDLFTKGPDPAAVFWLAHTHAAVLGNHDERLLALLDGRRRDDPMGRAVIKRLDRAAPPWREWTRSLPLFHEVAGFTVVHAGLHPSGELPLTTRKMALIMRRYPMKDPEAPFWWQQYTGERRVIFGHDAIRGLVRVEREGRPWLIGLDTGCCYGGALSGYVVEEDEIVQVPAAKRYWKP
ncbi:MAG: metallophosphoesterase [Myxococcota bacterium]